MTNEALVWMKVRKAIATIFNPEAFAAYIESLNEATQRMIVSDVNDPTALKDATESVSIGKYEIDQKEADSIFNALMQGRDFTQYGLLNAFTSVAHTLDAKGEADKATEFEKIGGDLAKMKGSEWRELVKV